MRKIKEFCGLSFLSTVKQTAACWKAGWTEAAALKTRAAPTLTFNSVSCCLNSSSSSESQSGNWYIFIPYCSISSRIYRETDKVEERHHRPTVRASQLSLITNEFTCSTKNCNYTSTDEQFMNWDQPYLDFLFLHLTRGECVSFRQDRHNVDLFMQSFHKLHIERPEAARHKEKANTLMSSKLHTLASGK